MVVVGAGRVHDAGSTAASTGVDDAGGGAEAEVCAEGSEGVGGWRGHGCFLGGKLYVGSWASLRCLKQSM